MREDSLLEQCARSGDWFRRQDLPGSQLGRAKSSTYSAATP